MNVEYSKKFISEIKELSKINNNSYLEMAVSNAVEYGRYGEYELALDIALDNLDQGSIFLDEEIVDLARQAFGKTITSGQESTLKILTKKL